jgi:hypothetical protein
MTVLLLVANGAGEEKDPAGRFPPERVPMPMRAGKFSQRANLAVRR